MRFQNGLIKTWAPQLMDFHASKGTVHKRRQQFLTVSLFWHPLPRVTPVFEFEGDELICLLLNLVLFLKMNLTALDFLLWMDLICEWYKNKIIFGSYNRMYFSFRKTTLRFVSGFHLHQMPTGVWLILSIEKFRNSINYEINYKRMIKPSFK